MLDRELDLQGWSVHLGPHCRAVPRRRAVYPVTPHYTSERAASTCTLEGLKVPHLPHQKANSIGTFRNSFILGMYTAAGRSSRMDRR